MIGVRDGTGLKSIGFVGVRDSVGMKECEAYVRDAGGLVQVHGGGGGSLTLDISGDAFGSAAIDIDISVTTSTVTVTPTGGSTPYVASWARIDDPVGTDWVILSPTSLETRFRKTTVEPNETSSATFACTVNGVVSDTITAVVQNYGGLGGLA